MTRIKQSPRARARVERGMAASREYLAEHGECEAHCAIWCTGVAREVHHKQGRVGELLWDAAHMIAVCNNCHAWLTAHPREAKARGLSESRLGKVKAVQP